MIVLAILCIPLFAAAITCFPLKKQWAAGLTLISSFSILVLTLQLAWRISEGTFLLSDMPAIMLKWISVDGLSALIILLIAAIGTMGALFSIGYMAHDVPMEKKLRLYYVNYNLFLFSMLAIPLMSDPTVVWIAVELTTLCSALLVAIDNTREALEAAWKYVLLSLMGAGIALFGFLVLFAAMQAGGGDNYTWQGLIESAPNMPPALLQMAFLMILIGLGTKVGLVPMHTWLPDAHSQAPSPVCALLSGVETTAILYVILRLFPIMNAAPDSHAETWAIILGLISVGTAVFLLLQVRDYKRMFAFSTVEHMGIILTAIGLGAFESNYSAMLQIVSHSLTKSFCFFAAGTIVLAVGTREISKVRDLFSKSPAISAALIFGGLAITGAPPLAVFLSEFSILRAGLMQEQYLVTGLLAVFIIIGFFGVMLHINKMVFVKEVSENEGHISENKHKFHLPFSCRLTLILAAIPVFILGVYIPMPLHNLMVKAAETLYTSQTQHKKITK
jgi:hydrogenase-4 component F